MCSAWRKVAPSLPRARAIRDGLPGLFVSGELGDLAVRNANMADFTGLMQSAVLDRPVVDQTELTGRYDFTLSWTPDDSQFAGMERKIASADRQTPMRHRTYTPLFRSRSGSSSMPPRHPPTSWSSIMSRSLQKTDAGRTSGNRMVWRRARRFFYLVCMLAAIAFPCIAAASEYRGQVTFGGLPLPGATVTVTQGTKKASAVTDQGGLYTFPDLADGPGKIEIEMLCFSTVTADVTISPTTAPGKWELTLLPLDQITKLTKLPPAPVPSLTARPKTPAAATQRERPGNTEAGGGCKPAIIRRLPGQRQRQQRGNVAVLTRPGFWQPKVLTARASTLADSPPSTITPPWMRVPTRSADSTRPRLLTTALPASSRLVDR